MFHCDKCGKKVDRDNIIIIEENEWGDCTYLCKECDEQIEEEYKIIIDILDNGYNQTIMSRVAGC